MFGKFLFRVAFVLTAINENVVPARVCVHITVHGDTTFINQSGMQKHKREREKERATVIGPPTLWVAEPVVVGAIKDIIKLGNFIFNL